MDTLSFSRWPAFPVRCRRSLPARSTNETLETQEAWPPAATL